MNKKGNFLYKFEIFIVLVIFLVIIISPIFIMNDIGASTGQHTGIITAVEFNNNILWDANLVYFKTNTAATQEDVYCVNDNAVKEQLIDFSKNHDEVTVYYHNNIIMWKWDCNGGWSIIYKVEKNRP